MPFRPIVDRQKPTLPSRPGRPLTRLELAETRQSAPEQNCRKADSFLPTPRRTVLTLPSSPGMAAMAASVFLASGQAAEAKGCIKGANVGGIAGHYAGHGILGAIGGCAAGRALANRQVVRQQVAPIAGANVAARPAQGAGGYVGF